MNDEIRAPARPGIIDDGDDRSIAELLSSLINDSRNLMSQELQLARAEITSEVQKAAKGGGLLGAGAFAGAMALLLLSFAAAWGLENVMDAGLAFLIVGVVWAIVAAVLALQGREKLKEVHPVPEQTKQTLEEDVQWAKNLKS